MLVYKESGKRENPCENLSEHRTWTNNKRNPHITPRELNPGQNEWWEASALITAPIPDPSKVIICFALSFIRFCINEGCQGLSTHCKYRRFHRRWGVLDRPRGQWKPIQGVLRHDNWWRWVSIPCRNPGGLFIWAWPPSRDLILPQFPLKKCWCVYKRRPLTHLGNQAENLSLMNIPAQKPSYCK